MRPSTIDWGFVENQQNTTSMYTRIVHLLLMQAVPKELPSSSTKTAPSRGGLSTAESELLEAIEGVVLGNSTKGLVEELLQETV